MNSLNMRCPNCQFDNPPSTSFCINCYAPLPVSQELPEWDDTFSDIPIEQVFHESTDIRYSQPPAPQSQPPQQSAEEIKDYIKERYPYLYARDSETQMPSRPPVVHDEIQKLKDLTDMLDSPENGVTIHNEKTRPFHQILAFQPQSQQASFPYEEEKGNYPYEQDQDQRYEIPSTTDYRVTSPDIPLKDIWEEDDNPTVAMQTSPADQPTIPRAPLPQKQTPEAEPPRLQPPAVPQYRIEYPRTPSVQTIPKTVEKRSLGFIVAIFALIITGMVVLILGVVLGPMVYSLFSSPETSEVQQQPAETAIIEKEETVDEEKPAAVQKEEPSPPKEKEETVASQEQKPTEPAVPPKKISMNPLMKDPPSDKLFKGQTFVSGEKIKYAGAYFTIDSPAKVIPAINILKGKKRKLRKLAKGRMIVQVEIMVQGIAKLEDFDVYIIDGSGNKRGPNSRIEGYLNLPDTKGGIHRLWKKISYVPEDEIFYLHRGFLVAVDKAKDFIIEIKHRNLTKVLWITIDHEVVSE